MRKDYYLKRRIPKPTKPGGTPREAAGFNDAIDHVDLMV
jgi:hypothetical protein